MKQLSLKCCTRAAQKRIKRLEEEEEEILPCPDIAKELMFEILGRLPIKCLSRFKCVSKYWFRLISSLDFTKLYFQKASHDSMYIYHKLLYMAEREDSVPTFRYAPLYPTFGNPRKIEDFQTDMSCPMKFLPEESLEFVGSCNGLVCITGSKNKVLVWNPTIRKCITLPNFGRGSSPVFYGFGYDEYNDEYKVVGISNTLVKVCSLRKTVSWKKLRVHNHNLEVSEVDSNGCFLNGKIHFATKKSIFTIHLSTDELSCAMEPPACVQECSDWKVNVAGENLVVFCYYRISHVDLWMMMRYGEKESWDKVNKRYPLDSFVDPEKGFRHIPCFVSKQGAKDGEILLHRLLKYHASRVPRNDTWRLVPIKCSKGMMLSRCAMSAFLLYNHKRDFYAFNNPRLQGSFINRPALPVIVYVESLIWPFP